MPQRAHSVESTPAAAAWLAPVARGASRAALAFEQLWGRPLLPRPAVLAGARAAVAGGPWSAGIYFELTGGLPGCVALLLRELPKSAPGDSGAPGAGRESLLLELANIVASQVVSSLADALSRRILLSIPSLVGGAPERELSRRTERMQLPAGGARIEVAFGLPGELPEMLLLLLADLPRRATL